MPTLGESSTPLPCLACWGTLALAAAFLAACAAPVDGADPTQAPSVRFSAKPAQEVYQLGEPIRIQLHFENQGQEDVTLRLGTSDVCQLSVSWKPAAGEAKAIERHGAPPGGVASRLTLVVPARGTATHEFLLNKLLVPERAGTFMLTVQIRETKLPAATSLVRVELPLRDRLKGWYTLATDLQVPFAQRNRVLEDLVYTQAPEALPYQMNLVDSYFLDLERLNACLASMLVGHQDEAVKFFAERLNTKDLKENLRPTILFAIKSYGWEKLSPGSVKLLGPHKTAIESATRLVIID